MVWFFGRPWRWFIGIYFPCGAIRDHCRDSGGVSHEHGYPTDIEIKEFLQWYSELLASDRETTLARLRAWLERDGEPLQ
jgi:hypothetical protein